MALTPKQIQELNAASQRRTAVDLKNIDYAKKNFGYVEPRATPAPQYSTQFTPPAGSVRIPNVAALPNYTNHVKDPNSNAIYGTPKTSTFTPPAGSVRVPNVAALPDYTNQVKDPNSNAIYGTPRTAAPTFTPPAGSVRVPNVASLPDYTNQVKDPSSNAIYGTPKIVRLPNGDIAKTNVPTPTNTPTTQTGNTPNATGANMTEINPLDQWKNQTNFLQTAKEIIQQKQGMSQQLKENKSYWENVYKIPDSFGNINPNLENPAGVNPVGTWTDESFRQLSPSDQASIRLARRGVASTALTAINDEIKYRDLTITDTLKYLSDIYNDKRAAEKDARDQNNEEARIAIAKEANNIAYLKVYNDDTSTQAAKDIALTKLKAAGVDIKDYVSQNLPTPYTPISIPLGNGHVSAYGSDGWKPGLDFVLDGGANAEIKLPFAFEIIKQGVNGGFGNQVQVKNLETGKTMWFSHLSKFADMGGNGMSTNRFPAGTSIGFQGSTGTSTGNHIDITMPKPGGGYYTAEEVAKEMGINQTQNTNSDLADIADFFGKDEAAFISAVQNGTISKNDLNNLRDVMNSGTKASLSSDFKSSSDQAKYREADIFAAGERAKGVDAETLYSALVRKFQNNFNVGELETIMTKAGYKKAPSYIGGWE